MVNLIVLDMVFILLRLRISLNLTSLDEQGVILSSYENSDVDWFCDCISSRKELQLCGINFMNRLWHQHHLTVSRVTSHD